MIVIEVVAVKKSKTNKTEKRCIYRTEIQLIVSAMKNPVSAIAFSIFFYGISVAPATGYALAGAMDADVGPLFGTSDWMALLLCFVVGMITIVLGFMDQMCSIWFTGIGREKSAQLCEWLRFRRERRLLVAMLLALFFASFSLFLWLWDCRMGIVLVATVVALAPVSLLYRANGIEQEGRLLKRVRVDGRDQIGNILSWAICPVLMMAPLFFGDTIFKFEFPGYVAILCGSIALLLCACCLRGAYVRIKEMRKPPRSTATF